ncbi:MAG: hypothetical protein HYS22_07370 [Deltaproteobacteria bacterium]|nr:hypothetical protein [Deltaproteobacteria bacterium]
MKRFVFLIPTLFFLLACGAFDSPDPTATEVVPTRERDSEDQLSLALGGVGPGMDEVSVKGDTGGQPVDFDTGDKELFEFQPLEGFNSFTDGGGARVIPKKVGLGQIWYTLAGKQALITEVTTPPQVLIQILIGEARGQLAGEAKTGTDGKKVDPSSVSPSADGVSAVIRNRIALIEEKGSPGLFVADKTRYYSSPPTSHYEAVIEASSKGGYQFSPVNPDDPTHEKYLAAASREKVVGLEENMDTAYDQAVLTAADAFNEAMEDPTGGAFAFYSPTAEQYENLRQALESETKTFPANAGTSDAQFPAFSPIQVLILKNVSPQQFDNITPSFVFVRQREKTEPAVTNDL